MSYTQAVALLGVPSEEREQFVEEHNVENMSTRELQKAIKELQDTQKQLAQEKAHSARLLEIQQSISEAKAKSEQKLRSVEDELSGTEKALKDAQNDIKEMEADLKKAQALGDSLEYEQLQKEMAESRAKITELEEQLAAKPIDVQATTVVEKIPVDVERELAELRAGQRSASEIKFRLGFDTLTKNFSELLSSLVEIETDKQEKYRSAVRALITKMNESL